MNAENERRYEPVDLGALLRMLWRRAWMIALTAILAAALVLLLIPQSTRVTYTASVDLYVHNSDTNNKEILADVNTCLSILENNAVLGAVIQATGLDMSVSELDSHIRAQIINDSAIINLKVNFPEEEQAEALANVLVAEGIRNISELTGNISCQQVDIVTLTRNEDHGNRAKYAVFAAALSAVIMIAFFLCRELFDRSIKNEEDAAACTGLRVLGVIPELKADRHGKEDRPHILGSGELPFAYVEAYKSLRTNFMFHTASGREKSITITSAVSNEAMYNAAANLAVALAEMGKRIILLDCNLRSGALDKYFELQSRTGLRDILSGAAEAEPCQLDAAGGKLKLILSGDAAENPSELLAGERMKQLIKELEDRYDYVLLAAPPVSVVTDAAVLGTMSDGALLVTRARFAPMETVQLAKHNLDAVDCNVIGLVLSRLDVKKLYSNNGYANIFKKDPSSLV